MLHFDVFGRELGVVREAGAWRAFYIGPEGKHRAAPDVSIPPWLEESRIAQFLDDLFHESASPERPRVARLSRPGDIAASDSC